uniref:GRIP domain-containing protein n=1 Tax=Parascaris univalens TaxID=6257 RepID=A0A915B351_PARUN
MSSWLRNLQGQLTELASEVLSEATEEVDDPESELQVAKKKCAEAERQLAIERTNAETLLKKVADLEEQLDAKNLELDSLNAKYAVIIESRDSQIRSLQVELERIRHVDESVIVLHEDEEDNFLSDGSIRSARMREEIEQLRKEVTHWKRIANETPTADHSKRILELERKLIDQRSKSEAEMAALVLAHNENIKHLREQYEAKIGEVQFHSSEGQNSTRANSRTEESDDWQKAWDDTDDIALPRTASAKNVSLELLEEKHKELLERYTLLTAEVETKRRENKAREEEIDRLTLQAIDSALSDQLRDVRSECERLKEEAHTYNERVQESNEEIKKLRAELEDAHALLDVQREKYEREKELEAEKNRLILEEASAEVEKIRLLAESRMDPAGMESLRQELTELSVIVAKQKEEVAEYQAKLDAAESLLSEGSWDKDKELEKLRRENNELTSAYNDLNEEFESHKAEHGSVVTSNRDLTARIDALKANLIEYEERYELCKAENAETVQQLEKLTNDFERLRLSFEASKSKPSNGSLDEVERLRLELETSKDERERLRSDVNRFRSAIGAIDTELNSLRESNEKLARDNMAMGASLDKFVEIRDMLEKSDNELRTLREKFVQLQAEHGEKEEAWRCELASVSEARDNAQRELEQCKMRITESETALHRYRSVVGEGAADIVEMKVATTEGKASSSEGTTDSNNGWEKMADWDASLAAGTSGGAHTGASLMDEMREALAMITEKTEECEELRRQKCEVEKELELRQNCVDELMAQTNALQSQQQIHAEAFSQMRDWANKNDREKMEVERDLIRTEEKLKEVNAELDTLREENANLLDRVEELKSTHKEETISAMEIVKKEFDAKNKEQAEELLSLKQRYEKDLNDVREEKLMLEERLKVTNEQLVEHERELNSVKEEKVRLKEQLKACEEQQTQCKEELDSVLEAKRLVESELEAMKEEKTEMFQRVEALQNELSEASECKRSMQEQLNAIPPEEVSKAQAELATLKEKLQTAEEKCALLEVSNTTLANDLESSRLAISEAERVRGELVTLVEQKHAESIAYHGQLQAFIAEREKVAEILKDNTEKIKRLEEEVASCMETRDKATRECQRLREHLLAVEDASTKEAVLAEERETELRRRVRELEAKTEATADTVIQSTNTYQQQISELSNEIDRLKEEKLEALERLHSTEKMLVDAQKALSNLQIVLRDLGSDHEAQIALHEEEMRQLKAEMEKTKDELITLRNKEQSLILEKQVLEDSAVHLKEEISRKETVSNDKSTMRSSTVIPPSEHPSPDELRSLVDA